MKHIGILAHSGDGAALCFLEMVREGARKLGAHQHPEITLSILPMGAVLGAYARGDLAAVNAHQTPGFTPGSPFQARETRTRCRSQGHASRS